MRVYDIGVYNISPTVHNGQLAKIFSEEKNVLADI